jgi:hypothetical protein
MSFATSWLESGTLFPLLIDEAPDKSTGIIVVVPAYDEPSIIEMIDSLALCNQPLCKTEVIIIINAALNASAESLGNNRDTFNTIEKWKKKNTKCFFRIYAINLGTPDIKNWGVGLARKAGMDEAAKRFNLIDKPDGIIANLDADCTVRKNYFVSLENELLKRKDRKGCSIYFEHPVTGDRFPVKVYDAIYQYELHLRYLFQALSYTGFPNVFHTVGSSIAIKCLSYVKAGGMNRRQAGEDFYFVQKLVPAGGYFSLNSTAVYPSPRASERVPFGTGAAVGKMLSENGNNFMTYNPLAFRDLYLFFEYLKKIFERDNEELVELSSGFPESIKIFLEEQKWLLKITEIKNNTAGFVSFRKRFFDWFNMFKVVKYLNFSHKSIFKKIPVSLAAKELMRYMKMDVMIEKDMKLLQIYRNMEKSD